MEAKSVVIGYALGYNDGLDDGGGKTSGDWQPWQRPLDWPAMPEPKENQIIFLCSSWGGSVNGGNESNSLPINPIDSYADDFTATIDWGDGNTSTAAKKDGRLMWTNSNGFNQAAMYEGAPSVTIEDNPRNYYINYDSDGNRHWTGGTVLNDGTRVFIVTVTVSDPNAVRIGNNCYWYPLEIYIGKKINLDWSSGGAAATVQHIKAFGWQLHTNNAATYSFGLFNGAYALKKISATEPFTEIPNNSKFNPLGLFFEMDFSEVTKIGEKAFMQGSNSNGFGNPKVDLPKCTEIANNAFNQNSYIKEINAPLVATVGNSAFSQCSNLIKINMPNAVEAGSQCFANCTKLQKINAPNLTAIGNNGLMYCYNLISFEPNSALNLNNAGVYQSYLWQDNPKYPYAFDDVI